LLAAVFCLGAKTTKMKKCIVVNIGCIECGVSSNIVGVFDNEEKANEIAKEFDTKFSWREGGQNSFEVFEMPELNVINTEYLEPVANGS
jgi:hypothetical protein